VPALPVVDPEGTQGGGLLGGLDALGHHVDVAMPSLNRNAVDDSTTSSAGVIPSSRLRNATLSCSDFFAVCSRSAICCSASERFRPLVPHFSTTSSPGDRPAGTEILRSRHLRCR
jgi:hypothetical protein